MASAVVAGWQMLSSFGSLGRRRLQVGVGRAFARIAPPRTDGLGTERISNTDFGGGAPAEEEALAEGPSELTAVAALRRIAPSHHKHARGYHGPPPLDAFGSGEDGIDDIPFWSEEVDVTPPLARRQAKPSATFHVLQQLSALERREGQDGSAGRSGRSRKRWDYKFPDDQPIRVRVLDIDAVPLEDVHKAFMHTLVRRRPAEVCVRIASRIAQFRDKYSQPAYETLLRDCEKLFGATHGPELVALFARCHATISVPYMLDYTRRFGQFSRGFIASQVDKSLQPAFFDFLRYVDKGGVRPLPLIVSQPWALSSYTRLMGKSHVRSHLHEQLVRFGAVPQGELEQDTAADLPAEARVAERLSAAGALQVEPPQRAPLQRHPHVERPALLDAIMEAEHAGGYHPDADEDALEVPAGSQVGVLGVGGRGARAGAAGARGGEEYEWRAGDGAKAEEFQQSFSLQFEHVVPDGALGVGSDDALVNLPESGNDGLEEYELPERYWKRFRQTFFRHMHSAYRLVDGQWRQVPDPRGPRFKPKRRHRPRSERKEAKLRREMHADA